MVSLVWCILDAERQGRGFGEMYQAVEEILCARPMVNFSHNHLYVPLCWVT